MKILIVEDHFAIRQILLKSLHEYGECDVAINGREAVEAVKDAMEEGDYYDLITMDIMMPEMNGIETLKAIRELERQRKMSYTESAKIIMSTALDDRKTILESFRDQCEAYIIKPVTKSKLVSEMKKLEMI